MQSNNLAALAAACWDFHIGEYPPLAAEHGDPRARHIFLKESIADHRHRNLVDREFILKLEAINREELPSQDRITYDLLHRELTVVCEQFRLEEYLRPQIYPFGPEAVIGSAISKTVLSDEQALQDYVIRLASIPQVFEDYLERFRLGASRGYVLPAALLEPVLATVRAYVLEDVEACAWYKPLRNIPKGTVPTALIEEVWQLIANVLKPAYLHYADELEAIYRPAIRNSVSCADAPMGREYYQHLVSYYTTADADPDEIHRTGLAEVERISTAILKTANEAGFGNDVETFQNYLRSAKCFFSTDANALRERIEVLSKRIDGRIPELFGLIPRMTYGVESVPEALAAYYPIASAHPNPANNTSAGKFWVTSLVERCPSYLHIPLVLHEGWPGHLMHIALLQEMKDLPAFRRYSMAGYIAYIEGWALYCEGLGEDLGLYSDPYLRYGRLEMEIHRAVRLVVDTGIHALGWTRHDAITYMQKYLTTSPAAIETEVNRYIGLPAQALSYKTGEMKILELRRRAEQRLGSKFSLKKFHDRLVTAGAVTLEVLEAHVQEWIEGAEH
ncbi:DUF885 domain-containing protein [Stenotrophobium rhamnosiphilum]|uniref:DUF885 domain-containing protein n=1 Tax=Stenotrophobium rhamnosiphilum TaxID=2029166 RepID=A0A2T5MCN1_9GAMM|nr:DUF885 domain-containing protein [Stenotrophobium rhamnosiphilum]PTU30321.1 hypothetical protein CJD38_15355 [Stenotrophobium rhamnosiphilum]